MIIREIVVNVPNYFFYFKKIQNEDCARLIFSFYMTANFATHFEHVADRLNRLKCVEPHRLRALTEQLFVYSRGRQFIIAARRSGDKRGGGLIIFRRRRMLARPILQSVQCAGTPRGIRSVGL